MNRTAAILMLALLLLVYVPMSGDEANAETYNTIDINDGGGLSDWDDGEKMEDGVNGVSFYITWDADSIFVAFEGVVITQENQDRVCVLFDTNPGDSVGERSEYYGAMWPSKPNRADYAIMVGDKYVGEPGTLSNPTVKYNYGNGSGWDAGQYPIEDVQPGWDVYMGWSGNNVTELQIPRAWLGNLQPADDIAVWAYASNSKGDWVWSSFPTTNPVTVVEWELPVMGESYWFANTSVGVRPVDALTQQPPEQLTVEISTPGEGAVWYQSDIEVIGTATGADITTVEISLDQAAWTPCTTTTDWETWSGNLTLSTGANTIYARVTNATDTQTTIRHITYETSFSGQDVYLAIIYHMHQPLYKNTATGDYELPWGRVHNIQEYIDHPKILEAHPDIKLTVNIVPSLIYQIEDWADYPTTNPDMTDSHIQLARVPAANLTLTQKARSRFEFLRINGYAFNYSNPASLRFRELRDKINAYHLDLANAVEPSTHNLTTQDYVDLKIAYFLWQFSPDYVEGKYNASERIPEIADMYNQSSFTEDQLDTILYWQNNITRKTLDYYKLLADRGQIELTTTPYYHPIMPLLMDDGTYLAKDGVPVKVQGKVPWPEDVQWQLQAGVDYFNETFGYYPVGMWPSEESVSENIIQPIADAGIEWIVTDGKVLDNSGIDCVNNNDEPDTADRMNRLYKPYLVEDGGKELAVVFRDRKVSDDWAWNYWKADPGEAAENFVNYIKAKAQTTGLQSNRLITCALDGENWMFLTQFRDNGRDFLDALYTKLEQTPWIHLTTPSEYLSMFPLSSTPVGSGGDLIPTLHDGSWIDGGTPGQEFDTWHGEEDENVAWQRLVDAHAIVVQRQDAISPEAKAAAWDAIYAAEGSDWFWWYGVDQYNPEEDMFDKLFKVHLKNAYEAVGADLPPYLSEWLDADVPDAGGGDGSITPVMDGVVNPGFEWQDAFKYGDSDGAAPGDADLDIQTVYVGQDTVNLYVRIDTAGDLTTLWDDGTRDISLYISRKNTYDMNVPYTNFQTKFGGVLMGFPAKWRVKLDLGYVLAGGDATYTIYEAKGGEVWSAVKTEIAGNCRIDDVVELRLQLSELGYDQGDTMRFAVVTEDKDAKALVDIASYDPDQWLYDSDYNSAQTDPADRIPQARMGYRPIEMTIPIDISSLVELVTIDDPVGDDYGPGSYTYPQADDFAPRHGIFDITRLRINKTDRFVFFEFSIAELPNIWSMDFGFSHPYFGIYVDRDNVSGSGETECLEGINALIHPDFAWEAAIKATGEQATTWAQFTLDGDRVTDGLFVRGNSAKGTVQVIASTDIVGPAPEEYRYVVFVAGQDTYKPGDVRPVDQANDTWVFGGGRDDDQDPNVIDLIVPDGQTQEAVLGAYTATTLAELSGVGISSIPLSITGLQIDSITSSSALVSWSTTYETATYLEYGLNKQYGTVEQDAALKKYHQVSLGGLLPLTTYQYRVVATSGPDEANRTGSFTTTDEADTTAPVLGVMYPLAEADLANTSATIRWTTNEAATSQLLYGTTNALGSATVATTTYDTSHAVTLTGLTQNTTYHFKAVSVDPSGNPGNSTIFTFTTLADATVSDELASLAVPWLNVTFHGMNGTELEIVWGPSPSDEVGVYRVYRSEAENGTFTQVANTTNRSYIDTGLIENTVYFYKVTGVDDAWKESDLATALVVSGIPLGDRDGDLVPDVYDEDDDNDGVPDAYDLDPLHSGVGAADWTLELDVGDYYFQEIEGKAGWVLDLRLEVLSGGEVDLLLLDAGNFGAYSNASAFSYYADGSTLSTTEVILSFDLPANGTYYVVLDNTYFPLGGAVPTGAVSAHLNFSIDRSGDPAASAGTGSEMVAASAPTSVEGERNPWFLIVGAIAAAAALLAAFLIDRMGSKPKPDEAPKPTPMQATATVDEDGTLLVEESEPDGEPEDGPDEGEREPEDGKSAVEKMTVTCPSCGKQKFATVQVLAPGKVMPIKPSSCPKCGEVFGELEVGE